MGKSTRARKESKGGSRRRKESEREQLKKKKKATINSEQKQASWAVMKSILSCKHLQVDHPQQQQKQAEDEINKSRSKKIKCSGSLCNNTKVIITKAASSENEYSHDSTIFLYKTKVSPPSACSKSTIAADQNGSSRSFVSNSTATCTSSSTSSSSSSTTRTTTTRGVKGSLSSSSGVTSFKGMPFRKLSLSGCYECKTVVVDPVLAGLTRDPSLRATISSCPQCGDIFMKPDLLQLHQATKHAVSELGPEDTSRNIVEIIFQSSWLKKEAPVCKIERILKVHNTNRTVSRFEEYRDWIKGKANRVIQNKDPRCIADGNELLRFHCSTLRCSLGLNGSSNLCNSSPSCSVCGIIRDGFKSSMSMSSTSNGSIGSTGILTTASSGRAHDKAHHPSNIAVDVDAGDDEPRKAMLVCRVIAGRVNKSPHLLNSAANEYDSVVAGLQPGVGLFSDLDELYVSNPKAILPCFVVIYSL